MVSLPVLGSLCRHWLTCRCWCRMILDYWCQCWCLLQRHLGVPLRKPNFLCRAWATSKDQFGAVARAVPMNIVLVPSPVEFEKRCQCRSRVRIRCQLSTLTKYVPLLITLMAYGVVLLWSFGVSFTSFIKFGFPCETVITVNFSIQQSVSWEQRKSWFYEGIIYYFSAICGTIISKVIK